MSTGENIKRIRTHRKMTQKELGEKLGGITQQQIGQWENGNKKPKLETIKKIADALNVNVNDLLENPLDDSPVYKAYKNTNSLDSLLAKDFINGKIVSQIDNWQQIDIELVKTFKKLNEDGKTVAVERIEELTEIPRYTQKGSNMPDKEE